MTGLLVAIGFALGGRGGMIIAFVMAIVMNAGAYWFSGDIALRMAHAREVSREEDPELHSLIDELATYARLPKPRVAVIQSPQPNAFATGRDPEHGVVAVTTGIRQILTRDELAGVLAHELGHIKNRDILVSSVAATIAGAITMVAHMAQWAMIFGGFGGRSSDDRGGGGLIGSLLAIFVAPIAATIIQLAISRSREFGADETGAAIHGNPEALARALEKLEYASARTGPMRVDPAAAHLFIVNPLKGASLAGLFSSHPPVAERVKRLRTMHLRSIY
jgi:heat shock protein HtpX